MNLRVEKQNKLVSKKEFELVDQAWDYFSDYIGEKNLSTPLKLEQFELIFSELNKKREYDAIKDNVLESFRYDSYLWPLVERDPK